ncbi:MAG: hypothetical protein V4794_02490 [Pseudomonadota bacterium]
MRVMVLVKATEDSEKGLQATPWETGDMEEAVAWVRRCPNPMPGPSEIEIRPLYEAADLA